MVGAIQVKCTGCGSEFETPYIAEDRHDACYGGTLVPVKGIAAAQDMLEALEMVQAGLRHYVHFDEEWYAIYLKVEAALAKAQAA